jgi:PAS domain S-box-containing protein
MESFFDSFPDPLLIWSPEGELIQINAAAEQFLGYGKEELARKVFDNTYPLFGNGAALLLPEILGAKQQEGLIRTEIPIRKKNGDLETVEVRSCIVRTSNESFRYMVIRDIVSLRDSGEIPVKETSRGFTECIPDMFEEPVLEFEIDADGFFSSVNSLALERTGYTLSDIRRGIHYTRILAPEDRNRGKADFERILQNEPMDSLEYSILRKDGTVFPILVSLRLMQVDGRTRGIRGIALDITEHKRVEHDLLIREKLNALGEMAGGVVHNFNNILSVILGYLDVVSLEKTEDQCRKVFLGIRQAALDGTEMVKRIQNFSQKRNDGDREVVDLNDIIHNVLEYLRPRFVSAENRITLITRLGNIPPVSVIPFEMREVLNNIIINALDAMPDEGVLTIRSSFRKGMVSVEIIDTGLGMSEETKRHLFEPFFTTKRDKGTGIGMSVSYAIVTKFGGEILVESSESAGTRISVLLPPLDERPQVTGISGVPESPGKAYRILVLDDEENICEILREFLSRDGHEVITADRGKSGIDLLETREFDILITDLNMPGVSGWDIACRVRRQFPDTFIIMLTGWGMQVEQRNRRERVVDRILNKPIDFSLLSHIIAEAGARESKVQGPKLNKT